jgi:glycosyltransferase involved in cell wall biosynthesis
VENRSEPIRVAILATHPIQYQAPLWRKLAARPEFKVQVFYGSDLSVRGYHDVGFGVQVRWDTPLTSGYSHTFLTRNDALQHVGFWRPSAVQIGARFDEFRPDVVLLNAYNGWFWLQALLAARVRAVPIVMRHEASDEAVARSLPKRIFRDMVLRVLYSQVERFAAIGTNARQHLLRLGVADRRIGHAPYCVDSDEFEKQFREWRPQRAARRLELGIGPADFALLFSGKLIPKKQPLLVLRAISELPTEIRARIHLIVLGDGEQRTALDVRGRALLGARFHATGFINQSEVGRWYSAADCLVLPSRRGAGETWGLVVNEALQFGLKVIVSDGAGCSAEFKEHASAVIVFNHGSPAELALAMERVIRSGPDENTARRLAAGFSIDAAAEGLAKEIQICRMQSDAC